MTALDPARPCIFAGNSYRRPAAAESLETSDPASLELVGRIVLCAEADVEAVVAAARQAQRDWGRLDAKSRAAALHRLADSIERTDFHDVALLMVREMGKPYPEATGELANCAAIFCYYAEMARDEAGKVAGTTQTGSFQFARYEPYGASVFTTSLAEAMQAAETLQAGMVWVNNPLIDNDALPFGGWKLSGVGRELGRQASMPSASRRW